MKVRLKTTYLENKAGDIYETDGGKAKQLVDLGRAEYLLEVPEAQNKQVTTTKRKYTRKKVTL